MKKLIIIIIATLSLTSFSGYGQDCPLIPDGVEYKAMTWINNDVDNNSIGTIGFTDGLLVIISEKFSKGSKVVDFKGQYWKEVFPNYWGTTGYDINGVEVTICVNYVSIDGFKHIIIHAEFPYAVYNSTLMNRDFSLIDLNRQQL